MHTIVTNLSNNTELAYSLPILEALVSAYEQITRKNWDFSTYPKPEQVRFSYGQKTVSLGDFCAPCQYSVIVTTYCMTKPTVFGPFTLQEAEDCYEKNMGEENEEYVQSVNLHIA